MKIGKRVEFHGAFKTKRRAVAREKKGEFIIGRRIKGEKRFLLLSPRKRHR